jgi:hypothetical protein
MTISIQVPVVTPPASSGAFVFNPILADILDEAYERLGLDPQALTLRHIISARRSMNLMLKDWFNRGVHQWAMDLQQVPVTVGLNNFTTPTGTIDIFGMVLRRQGVDTEMHPIGREDYLILHNKAQQGRPDRYFVDRQIPTPVVNFWMAGENTTDIILYYRFLQLQDVGGAVNSLNIPDRFYEAFCAGLAAKLARKWAPELLMDLRAEASDTLERAILEDRERAPATINPKYTR